MLVLLLLAAMPPLTCPRGLTAIDGDACAYLPEKPAAVVVYFHGMLPGTANWSRVRELSLLGAEAKKRNVAVIALRGEQGLCTWAKDVQQHWCWPSDRSQLPDIARVVERIGRVAANKRPVLAGFSNGGYFVTLLATETALDAAAYVVMHAGPVTGQTFALERARPALLLGASKDTFQLPGMKRLAATLEEAQWPAVKFEIREGMHEVTAADVKSLFDFVGAL